MGIMRNLVTGKYIARLSFRSTRCRILAPVIGGLLLSLIAVPVSASSNTSGLSVTNASIIDTVSAGQVLTQTMTVSIGSTDPATDLTVSVDGVTQSSNGTLALVSPTDDTSADSARTFVSVTPSSFHLEPGQSQDITATITIPQNIGSGGYFALIDVANPPSVTSGTNVALVYSVGIPVYLTIKGSKLVQTGTITGISDGDITNGKPIDITTNFQNTGNIYFKIEGETTVTNGQGVLLDDVPIPLTSSSIIPGMSRDLDAIYTPSGSMEPGTYTIGSKIMLSDGTILAQSDETFTIQAPYVPPPALGNVTVAPAGASTLQNADGSISIYFPVGAAAIPVNLALNTIATTQLPVAPTGFTLTGSCFQVNGLTGLLAKNATVTVKYTSVDLSKANGKTSSLQLLRWDPGTNQWVVLKTKVDTKAMTLSASSNLMGIWAVAVGTVPTSSGINWIVIGGIIAVVVIIIALATWLLLSRRKPKQKPAKR
ncbi:MAG: hypothetical protein WCA62_10460 [Dehalococcoidales bacterium]